MVSLELDTCFITRKMLVCTGDNRQKQKQRREEEENNQPTHLPERKINGRNGIHVHTYINRVPKRTNLLMWHNPKPMTEAIRKKGKRKGRRSLID